MTSPETKAGRYEIEREIAHGAMGRVFRARDMRLGRVVALKMLPAGLLHDAELRRRLAQEARAASALSEPGVATVYDYVEQGDDSYIVYEYVEGETLRRRMDGHHFSTEEVLDIGTQLADALAAAHERGIVHRDLKPENIMLTTGGGRPGQVKILDFGLAKLRGSFVDARSGESLAETAALSTQAGLIVGTVNYMAPEQLEGVPVDARTDLFALGLVLYEMSTRTHPFVGRTPASTISNILKLEVPPPGERNPATPPELDRIICKCLRKRPEERYQSARELQVDLRNLRRDLTADGERGSSVTVAWTPLLPIGRGPARFLLGLIQCGYLSMYGFAFFYFGEAWSRLVGSIAGFGEMLAPLLFLSALIGAPTRLFLLLAVLMDYPDFGRRFHRLFPVVLGMDLAWAASPLTFLNQWQMMTLLCSAGLAFLPFSQRTLAYTAYAPRGGRTSAIRRLA